MEQNEQVKKRTSAKQKVFLKAFETSFGNISEACKNANIGRGTYYRWMKLNPRFAQQVEDLNEELIDYAESKLLTQIMDNNTTAIIFFLKTKGKKRGYIETVENDVTVNPFLELMKAATNEKAP